MGATESVVLPAGSVSEGEAVKLRVDERVAKVVIKSEGEDRDVILYEPVSEHGEGIEERMERRARDAAERRTTGGERR